MKAMRCQLSEFMQEAKKCSGKVRGLICDFGKIWLFAAAIGSSTVNAADKVADEKLCTAEHMPTDLSVTNGIVYKQVGGQKLDLMLFQPLHEKSKPAPLLFYIHGGGWSGGDKYKILRPHIFSVVRELNRQGVICASIEYRLAKPDSATTFDSAADCKDALAFLVRNAKEYGIDPSRVGLFGCSAGGHLALVTALGKDEDYPCDPKLKGPSAKIKCVGAFYPRVSFSDPDLLQTDRTPLEKAQKGVEKCVGGPPADKREIIHLLSPLELIQTNSPAILLVHGDKDDILPVGNSLAMRDAAQAKGVPVECIICNGAGHCLDGKELQPTEAEIVQRTVEFFMRNFGLK